MAPRTQPATVRRDQLLDAAQQLLLAHGLKATTVADVAAAAGVAKGTVYLYFTSKDDLLAALRARYLAEHEAAIADARTGTVADRLRAAVAGVVEVSVRQQHLHHLLFHEAGFSEDDALGALREAFEELITTGVDAGELRFDDIAVATSFVLHGVHGALVDAIHRGVDDVDAVARSIADLAVRSVGGV